MPTGVPYRPPEEPLLILHSDASILIVDKPSGLLSVPGKADGLGDCLETRLRAIHPETLLIHRLDMATSGVMVFARTPLAQRHLNWQFERRQVRKTYIARVYGHPDTDAGEINLPLIADWPNRPLQKVCHETGKPAETHWQVLELERAASRLRLTPRTGRSHQLRVHMRELGHPILGDTFYASGAALAAADRLQLHAETLTFRHPEGGEWITYEAQTPF
nr:RluA family pseudouridine synthase [Algicella marina]